MKILQINSVYKQGSTGHIVANIHSKIKDNNMVSYVAYGRGMHDEDSLIRIGNDLDMQLHALGTRLFDKHGLYSKRITQEFIETIDKLDMDIFHLHNIHGYYLNYPILFEYLKDKKVVWTLHDCWSFTGHCSYYEYVGCDKWQTHCEQCPQLSQYPKSYFIDNSENNFSLKKQFFTSVKDLTIITPSTWLKNEVKKSFLKHKDMRVIHNGIDLDIFQYRESSFRKNYGLENRFIILGVANIWEERKGFKYFLKFSKLLEQDEVIVLVGLNKNQLQDLPTNIIGIERTSSAVELAEIYSSADVFANPTLEDNFPTTNLESLACGTPVVTFKSGGSPECIDEQTGYNVAKRDIEEMIDKIRDIKKNGRDSFSQYCIERAKNYFDKEDRFLDYIKLYKTIEEKGEIKNVQQ